MIHSIVRRVTSVPHCARPWGTLTKIHSRSSPYPAFALLSDCAPPCPTVPRLGLGHGPDDRAPPHWGPKGPSGARSVPRSSPTRPGAQTWLTPHKDPRHPDSAPPGHGHTVTRVAVISGSPALWLSNILRSPRLAEAIDAAVSRPPQRSELRFLLRSWLVQDREDAARDGDAHKPTLPTGWRVGCARG